MTCRCLMVCLLVVGCATGNPVVPRGGEGGVADASFDGAAPDSAASPGDAGRRDATAPVDAAPIDGGPMTGSCGVEPCALWILRDDGPAWERHPMPPGPFGPASPIRAAFDAESLDLAWVLTDTTYHVLRLSDRRWTAAGARDDLFPEASGVTLVSALSIPAGHGGGDPTREGIQLSAVGTVYTYQLDLGTRSFRFDDVVTDFGEAWTSPLAPSRSAMDADWLDLDNAAGWATGDPMDACGASTTEVGPHLVIMAAGRVHVFEAGQCFVFTARADHGAFPPFARANAPAPDDVGAAFFHASALWTLSGR